MDHCEGIFNCVCKAGFYFAALEKYEELEQVGEAAAPSSCCMVTRKP